MPRLCAAAAHRAWYVSWPAIHPQEHISHERSSTKSTTQGRNPAVKDTQYLKDVIVRVHVASCSPSRLPWQPCARIAQALGSMLQCPCTPSKCTPLHSDYMRNISCKFQPSRRLVVASAQAPESQPGWYENVRPFKRKEAPVRVCPLKVGGLRCPTLSRPAVSGLRCPTLSRCIGDRTGSRKTCCDLARIRQQE